MNDCPIAHPFVSDFHAVVELISGQLCLRDLDSRNGVFDASMTRLPSYRAIPLGTLGHTFILGRAVQVTVESFDDQRAAGERAPSSVHGSILGNRAALESEWPASNQPRGGYTPADASFGLPALPPLSMADPGAVGPPPGARSVPHVQVPMNQQSLPPLAPLSGLAAPEISPRPASRPPPGRSAVGPQTQHLAMSTEVMALIGLRELGASLVPGAKLETTGDLARLLTKIHDLLEVSCRCFIPLRDARLSLAAARRRFSGSRTVLRIEQATDPASIAAALLDWRSQDFDGAEAVEDVLRDLVMQHTTIVESVERGIALLLDEISPETIERSVAEDAGIGAVLGRYRALWQGYRERFETVSKDKSRQLELIFGSQAAAGRPEPHRTR